MTENNSDPTPPPPEAPSRIIEAGQEQKGLIVMPVAAAPMIDITDFAPSGPPAPQQAAPADSAPPAPPPSSES